MLYKSCRWKWIDQKRSAIVVAIVAAVVGFGHTHAYAGSDHEHDTDFYLGSYDINDPEFGTIVKVVLDEANKTRNIQSNALPNHTTGEFPGPANPNRISAQELNYSFTLAPVNTGKPTDRHTVGVSVNGLVFEPQTNEWFVCESGEEYRIEAIQERFNLGLDFNNAHVQPNGEYHFHGIPEAVMEDAETDLVLVGFAADGFLMYSSKSDAYKSGYTLKTTPRQGSNCTYTKGGPTGGVFEMESQRNGVITDDWEFTGGDGTLDMCNGTIINGAYAYVVTSSFPFVPRCLMGEVEFQRSPPPPSKRKGDKRKPPKKQ